MQLAQVDIDLAAHHNDFIATPLEAANFVRQDGAAPGDLCRLFWPRQFNPFDINPLHKITADHADFEALRSRRAIRLFIAATRPRTGARKLCENWKLSADALRASARLPTMDQAIEIDREE